MSYDHALDVISYINGTSHANEEAFDLKQQTEVAIAETENSFEVSANELDDLLSEIIELKKLLSKRVSIKPVASPAA